MNILDVMKEIGRRWHKISRETREYLQKKVEIDKLRFARELESFKKQDNQLNHI